jgi:hypothetical protein
MFSLSKQPRFSWFTSVVREAMSWKRDWAVSNFPAQNRRVNAQILMRLGSAKGKTFNILSLKNTQIKL